MIVCTTLSKRDTITNQHRPSRRYKMHAGDIVTLLLLYKSTFLVCFETSSRKGRKLRPWWPGPCRCSRGCWPQRCRTRGQRGRTGRKPSWAPERGRPSRARPTPRGKVDELEVVLDTSRGDRLGERVAATSDLPRDEDVGTLDVVLLGNVVDDAERGLAGTGGTERRVSLGQDVLALEPLDELGLGESEGKLDLVDDGLDAARLEELLGAANGEVGDTNVLDKTLVNELLEVGPDLGEVLGGLQVEQVLAGLGVLLGVTGELTLGDVLGDESDVPVHEVKVEVLYAELVKGVLNGLTNVVVVVLEELGGDPDLLTGNTRELDTLSDLVLVLVTPGAVNVTVARLESVADSITDLALGRLPGAETDRGDGSARVELEVRSRPARARREIVRRRAKGIGESAACSVIHLPWIGS